MIQLGIARYIATNQIVAEGDEIVSNVTGRKWTFIAIYWGSDNVVRVQGFDHTNGVVRTAYAKNFGLKITDR